MTSSNILETHNAPLIAHSLDYSAAHLTIPDIIQVQEQVHLTSEPAPDSSYVPPSPEQIIAVPQIPDERPIFSRHSVDDKIIFPTRKPLRNVASEQYATFLESMYSIFNKAYATWTGTNEESKSPQVSSPISSSYSGISPSNAKSEPITRERDRYEAWPFIGTASQYDINNYTSEDQDESFEAV